jgi:hypothetical protein
MLTTPFEQNYSGQDYLFALMRSREKISMQLTLAHRQCRMRSARKLDGTGRRSMRGVAQIGSSNDALTSVGPTAPARKLPRGSDVRPLNPAPSQGGGPIAF